MSLLRAFLCRHSRLAGLLVIIALMMKALVPAGYMVGAQGHTITVEICADASGGHLTRQIAIPHQDPFAPAQAEHAKTEGICAFSALGMAALGGADAVLLALALVFILALGFAAMAPPVPARLVHLRPPLRGPPAIV